MHLRSYYYVIHAYSGFEKKVAQSIEEQARQLGMDDMIDQIMVPTEEIIEIPKETFWTKIKKRLSFRN